MSEQDIRLPLFSDHEANMPHNANPSSSPIIAPVASFQPSWKHCKHIDYSIGSLVSPRAEEIKVCIEELRGHSLLSQEGQP